MTETIPNELLEAILFHALTIPSAVFEAWRTHRTFCGSPRSGVSSLLLVSKRWHTLGTSPLYESAILRTSAQVQAFAQTLTDRKDKQRTPGRYLRRLRIEGGFGGAAINVLTAAPGITTLYLGFDLTNHDSMSGLTRTLKKVSLKHLLLDSVDGGLLSTTMGINLSKAVAGALPHWKQLKRIDTSPRFIFLPEMLPALTKAPALEVITMSNYTMTVNIDGNILAALGKNASVKVIQIRHLDTSTPIKLLQHVDHFAKTKLYVGVGKDMVKLTDFPEMEPVKEDPGPLPELPDKIWDRILDYATHVDNREMDDTLFRLSRPSMNRTRKAILLLNKRFSRLGLRHMYSIPHLAREDNVDAFITVIEDNHNLSRLVRVLYLPEAIAFVQRKYIVAPLTNLEKVSKHFLVFPDMAQFIQEGENLSLQHASQWLGEGLIDSTFFKPFASLRILALYDRYGTITEEIPRDAFPKLESLDVWGWDLIDKFTPAELPLLRVFTFEANHHFNAQAANFLEVHGHKLRTLCVTGASEPQPGQSPHPLLDFCPNLKEMSIPSTRAPSNIPFLKHSQPHANISRLVFPNLIVERSALEVDASWDLFVEHLTLYRDKLPALKEFCVLTSLRWPINHFEYEYFALTPLIDDLHALGITFMDSSGTQWTRFEPVRKRWSRKRVLQLRPAMTENQESAGISLDE